MIEFLLSVDTPTLANAVELLDLRPRERGFTPLQVRCLFPELGRMCGYAVTAQVESVTSAPAEYGDGHLRLYEALAAAPKPAVIVLQEIGGYADYAVHCGEVMATCFTRLGAIGLVSDCGVRDVPEVRALKFHYFARGTAASHANFGIVRVGVPVNICGMAVKPGDLLHGDENGLLQIPAAALDRLPDMVERVRQKERVFMEFVRGEEFSMEGLRARMKT